MKRLILLSAIILAVIICPELWAADITVTLVPQDTILKRGDYLTLYVEITTPPDILFSHLSQFRYDPNAITTQYPPDDQRNVSLEGSIVEDLGWMYSCHELYPGKFRVVMAGAYGTREGGLLFKANLKIRNDAKLGDYAIKLDWVRFNEYQWDIEVIPAQITIVGDPESHLGN